MDQAKLNELIHVINDNFESMDIEAVTILLAVAAAHSVPGEMIWLRLIGASRSGKTEILRALSKYEYSEKMEHVTPASIRGGLKDGHRLLKRIDRKLVITKELASMLTRKTETRNQLFGLFRSVKDGELISDFGTDEDVIEQKFSFDWIVATTPAIVQYRNMENLLGARFIDLVWRTANREEMARKALSNNPNLEKIRKTIAAKVAEVIDEARNNTVELTKEEQDYIIEMADTAALLRTPVARDRFHNVSAPVAPEIGTDLAQGLSRIAIGLKMLGVEDIRHYVARLCIDSVPSDRLELVQRLLENNITAKDSMENYKLEDLKLIGICEKGNSAYFLKDKNRFYSFSQFPLP